LIEVSVGVFSDEEVEQGEWNGEQYMAIAKGLRPDHLAILPDMIGACSIEDGCGIRLNSNKKKGGDDMSDSSKIVVDDVLNEFDKKKLDNIQNILTANMDQGYKEMVESAQKTLDAMDDKSVYYLENIDDTNIIYSKRNCENSNVKMYRQQYEEDISGNFKLIGDSMEVKQKIDYVPVVTHMVRSKFSINNKGGNKMDAKKECGQCMEKVVSIIKTNAAGFNEADREWLLTQEEGVLDKILSKEAVVAPVKETALEVTSEQILNAMSVEDKAALAYGKKQLAEKRTGMIKGIQDNAGKENWPDEVLNNMDEDMLGRVFKSVKKEEIVVTDYSFMGTGKINTNNAADIALYPAGIEIETK